MDKLSFTLQFTFEQGDGSKAVELHKLLKKHGVLSKISFVRGNGIEHRKDRFRAILKTMDYGKEYTTGSLWKKYGKVTNGGQKTFQRDLNTMVVTGLIQGRIGKAPRGVGRTTYWSKQDIYGGEKK